MADKLLDVNGLTVSVEEKEILHDINLSINKGETHVLMGPNGAGKSTLGLASVMDLHLWAVLNIRLIQAKYFLTEKTLTMKHPIKGQRTEFFFHSKVLWKFRGFHFHRSFVMLLKRTVAKESAFGTLKKSSDRQWSFCRWIRHIPSVI